MSAVRALVAAVAIWSCSAPAPRAPRSCAWWIVRDRADGMFLLDTCAHGLWTRDPAEATAFTTVRAARGAVIAAEVDAPAGFDVVCAP